ncbi:MAG: FG-GAP-like repeat-containing protein [Planctomycetaceae bacterium]|nr:FG-GAP-like repeat-containing protein [Planctomycetaceae bacterium]
MAACRESASLSQSASSTSANDTDIQALKPAVTAFCGDCHASPPPASFPQDAWFAEVEQGYRFYLESGRADLKPPPMRDAVAYFRAQAPKTLANPSLATPLTTAARFRKQSLPPQRSAPAISFLDRAPQRGTGRLWFCDMHSGALSAVTWNAAASTIEEIAHLAHPAHFAVCDLDQDGRDDLIVADLGSFVPGDHQHGKVWWLPGAAESEGRPSEPRVLLDQIGRVADVRPADFDGDGDVDLVVAEFGWRKTGRILVLLQSEPGAAGPEFQRIVVDDRHGTIHVPVCDLNQDGKPDFLALISQEHELIEAYLNVGDGRFEKRRIFNAGDPAFGFSGMEVVDLDRDGDLDVLATNGDTLDSHSLKPSHGVHWLENRGEFPFLARRLADLPGAMRAVAADLDGDADLDVIAAAFLPATLRKQQSQPLNETLMWLEQTQPGEFVRHSLEVGEAGHMTVLAADLDADGDTDLAVPNYAEQRTVTLEPLVIWWNEPPR